MKVGRTKAIWLLGVYLVAAIAGILSPLTFEQPRGGGSQIQIRGNAVQAELSTAQVKAQASKFCSAKYPQSTGGSEVGNCSIGYEYGYFGKTDSRFGGGPYDTGYAAGKDRKAQESDGDAAVKETINGACPTPLSATLRVACLTGFNGGLKGKSKSDACKDVDFGKNASENKTLKQKCEEAFDKGVAAATGIAAHDEAIANAQQADDADSGDACGKQVGALGWIFCPAVQMVADLVDTVFQPIVKNMLKLNPLSSDGENKGLYTVWDNFRTLANALLVVVFLIIIFANIVTL